MSEQNSKDFLKLMAAQHSEVMTNDWDRETQKRAYHYTSLQGGLAILEGTAVWAGHIEFTNDSGEISESKTLIREIIENKRANHPNSFWKNEYFNEEQFDFVLKNIDPFIFSMSGDLDSSSQWRSYGAQGFGVAIGFDVSDLNADFIESNSLNILKVQYSKEGFRKALEKLFTAYNKIVCNVDQSSPEYSYHSTMMHAALLALSLSFKTHHHSDENEFRILYYQVSDALLPMFPNEEDKILPIKYRAAGGSAAGFSEFFAPYVEIEYRKLFPIREIIVGSKTEKELMEKALARLQKTTGLRFSVRFSNSKLR